MTPPVAVLVTVTVPFTLVTVTSASRARTASSWSSRLDAFTKVAFFIAASAVLKTYSGSTSPTAPVYATSVIGLMSRLSLPPVIAYRCESSAASTEVPPGAVPWTLSMYGGVRPVTSMEKEPSGRVETWRLCVWADESVRETVPETGPLLRATPVTPEPETAPEPHAASATPRAAAPSHVVAECFFGIFMRPPRTLMVGPPPALRVALDPLPRRSVGYAGRKGSRRADRYRDSVSRAYGTVRPRKYAVRQSASTSQLSDCISVVALVREIRPCALRVI